MSELSELLKGLAKQPEVQALMRELADSLRSALMSETAGDEWIDQYRSPLRLPGQKSSKRHCHLVRERIARLGPGHGAFISPDEKQFFLTSAALCEEMRGFSPPAPLAKTEPVEGDALPAAPDPGYAAVMRLVHGGKR